MALVNDGPVSVLRCGVFPPLIKNRSLWKCRLARLSPVHRNDPKAIYLEDRMALTLETSEMLDLRDLEMRPRPLSVFQPGSASAERSICTRDSTR